MASIDLNADLGEGMGTDDALLGIVSSCNIACGGHAGDEASMAAGIAAALSHGVAIGAHPSYPDREGFGRAASLFGSFSSSSPSRQSLRLRIVDADAELQRTQHRSISALAHAQRCHAGSTRNMQPA